MQRYEEKRGEREIIKQWETFYWWFIMIYRQCLLSVPDWSILTRHHGDREIYIMTVRALMFYSHGSGSILETFLFNYLTGSFEYRRTVCVAVKYLSVHLADWILHSSFTYLRAGLSLAKQISTMVIKKSVVLFFVWLKVSDRQWNMPLRERARGEIYRWVASCPPFSFFPQTHSFT